MAQTLRVQIVGDTTGYNRALGQASGATQKFGRGFSGSIASFAKGAVVFTAVTEGLHKLTDGLTSTFNAGVKAQEQNDLLTQALKNQGSAMSAESKPIQQLEKDSRKLGFANTETRDALLKLVQAKKPLAELTQAQNLARASGQSLADATTGLIRLQAGNTRAAKQYGIVLPPVTKNVDALKKSGEDLTTAQGKQDLAMAKVQDKLATGGAYYDALTKKVKDQAQVFSESAGGGISRFHAELQNLQEVVGAKLVAGFQAAEDHIGKLITIFEGAGSATSKLTAAFESVGLSAGTSSQIASVMVTAFNDARAAVQTGLAAIQALWAQYGGAIMAQVRAIWEFIKAYVQGAMNVIRGIVNVIGGLLQGDWSRVWLGIRQIFTGVWQGIVAEARLVWATLGNLIRVGLTSIRATMSAAWSAVKALTSAAWNAVVGLIRSAVSSAVSAATAVGRGIVSGIEAGLSKIVAVVKGGLDRIWGVISSVASSAYHAAIAIGAELVHGIAAGIESAIGSAIHAVEHAGGAVVGAAKGFFHIGSPSKLMADEVGKPIVEGIALGIWQNAARAGEAAAAAARMIAAKMAAAKPAFVDAFRQFASDALAAFDARMAAWVPPSQRLLDKMQLQDQAQQGIDALGRAIADIGAGGASAAADMSEKLGTNIGDAIASAISQISGAKTAAALNAVSQKAQQQVTDAIRQASIPAIQQAQSIIDAARTQLATAQASGDPDAIKAAQDALDTAVANAKALDDAVRGEVETATQELIAAEQRRHDAIASKQRDGLAKELSDLQAFLAKHPAEWDKASQQIIAILRKYDVPMYQAGQRFASRFADGLRSGIAAVAEAARSLAAALDQYVPHSPAKKGPLSYDAFKVGKQWASAFAGGLSAGGFPSSGVIAGTSLRSSGGGSVAAVVGGGAVNISLTVHAATSDPDGLARALVRPIARELKKYDRGNSGILGLAN